MTLKTLGNQWVELFKTNQYDQSYTLQVHLLIAHLNAMVLFKENRIEKFNQIFQFLQFIIPLTPKNITFQFCVWYTNAIKEFFDKASEELYTLKQIAFKPFPAFRSANQNNYNKLCKMFDDFNFNNIQTRAILDYEAKHLKDMEQIYHSYFDEIVMIQPSKSQSNQPTKE